MSEELFRREHGEAAFQVRAPWELHIPSKERPAGGWPLVWALHGWGMSAGSFAQRCRELLFPEAAVLFPQGPYSFEMRHGERIRIGHAWYLYDGSDEPFRSTLVQTEKHLLDLIEELTPRFGLDPSRQALFGFSQGVYAGYFLALRNPHRFRAMVAVAGGRLRESVLADRPRGGPRVPFLLLHGRDDRSVPLERAELMRRFLADEGHPVELLVGDAGHEVTPEMLAEARRWLREHLLP